MIIFRFIGAAVAIFIAAVVLGLMLRTILWAAGMP